MEKQLSYLPLNELPQRKEKIGSVGQRPWESAAGFLLLGVVMLIFPSSLSHVLAAVLMAASVLVFRVADHPNFEVYEDAILFLDPQDESKGALTACQEITEWSLNAAGTCQLLLKFADGSQLVRPCYQPGKASFLLKKVMLEKERSVIIRRQRCEAARKSSASSLLKKYFRPLRRNSQE
jgi:hypothetical protein